LQTSHEPKFVAAFNVVTEERVPVNKRKPNMHRITPKITGDSEIQPSLLQVCLRPCRVRSFFHSFKLFL